MFFELHRVTNTNQGLVLLQYCLKTIFILQLTRRDMNISIYAARMSRLRDSLQGNTGLVTSQLS